MLRIFDKKKKKKKEKGTGRGNGNRRVVSDGTERRTGSESFLLTSCRFGIPIIGERWTRVTIRSE